MSASFTFLSTAEFARLSSGEKLAYLSDAMEELERLNMPRTVRGWDSLFSQPQQQQQQQPQPSAQHNPSSDPDSPATS